MTHHDDPDTTTPARRTKRRYAHELYPHAEEGEVRPLAVEVPYLYARMVGYDIWGTGWFADRDSALRSGDRIQQFIAAKQLALVADAVHQGLAGDEAWAWAAARAWDESSEVAYERAHYYGVPLDRIKPYPCGPEPDDHDHRGEPDARGWRTLTRVAGRESECPDCTEPADERDVDLTTEVSR